MSDALSSIKALVKPLLPTAVLNYWRRRSFEAEQFQFRDMQLNEVFEQIYETNIWQRDGSTARYRSGPGSDPSVTARYEAYVVDYLMRNPMIERLVDIGCGDFQVSGRILAALEQRQRPISYVGYDIASNVVAYNREHFAKPGVDFTVLDVSKQVPPDGDIVTVREVFQHLSNAHILAALDNLRQRFDRAIVTESIHPAAANPNIDIISGYRTRDGYDSGVFIDLPPFNLEVLEEHTFDWSPTEQFRTTVVALR